ncbi:MAG: TetR/AcrR family transcriptional regulator [Lachnospiraceae bacterium]|nr:TetR/AcrR family transcriptional regulator [Lachnospiraceae bacterium]
MKKGEKRKQELLGIAYRMFLTRGYEETSVDGIINEAGIAKGTFYYHFESKEQVLEEVIGMMIEKEAKEAEKILAAQLPIPIKILGIINAFQPSGEEIPIEEALNRPENALMHEKIRGRLYEAASPLLCETVREGIGNGVFSCEDIPERVKILLLISSALFDDADYTKKELTVFLDVTEKILGAKEGSLGFLSELIEKNNGQRYEEGGNGKEE